MSEWDDRAKIAVKDWVLAKHNEHETKITRRILDRDQIERAWFDHLPGYAYSEYTEEGPEAAIEYLYTNVSGEKMYGTISIEATDVGAFLAELIAFMPSAVNSTA